jgi:hypothetical protein
MVARVVLQIIVATRLFPNGPAGTTTVASEKPVAMTGPAAGPGLVTAARPLRAVVAVTKRKLVFGPWETIFHGEFDGHQPRRVPGKVIGGRPGYDRSR